MCGIAGIWQGGGDPRPIAAAMAAALAHRGPDGDGVWGDPAAGLALSHRRLAIIDLSEAGRQPMVSPSGRYVVTYNGEIYNFAALRDDLAAQGARFRGGSDTEVLLAAIDAWGVAAAVERCVGMFAFALWDRRDRRLTLVRDRVGIKPLLWGRVGGAVVFASELRAIAAHPDYRPAMAPAALAALLRLGHLPPPLSIHPDLRQVPPGCRVTIKADGRVEETRYWDPREIAAAGLAAPRRDPGFRETEALLADAVGRRMVADRPVGAFLSGGIDSTTVTALMARASDRPIRTFTIGFADRDYDESASARAVARHLGTEHTELIVDEATALDVVARLPSLFDEPFADASAIPTALIAAMARQHVVVALSGDGGDETFAGYNRHRLAARLDRLTRALPRSVRRGVSRGLAGPVPAAWDRVAAALPRRLRPRQAGEKLHKLARSLAVDDPAAVYPSLVGQWPGAALPLGDPVEPPGDLLYGADPPAGWPAALAMQVRDVETYLAGDILTKVDRATMAVGLEARVPLLDHRVIARAWALAPAERLSGGETKRPLRAILDRHVPPALTRRPKSGFAVPLHRWLRGPLRDWAEDLLTPAGLTVLGPIEPAPIRALWADHLAGRANHQYALWPVLMAAAWWRAQAAPVSASAPPASPSPAVPVP